MVLAWAIVAMLSFPVLDPATRNVMTVRAADGTALHVLEHRYEAEPRPTVILIGDRADGADSGTVDKLAEQLFHRGLDVVTWDRRGTGDSSGTFDFGRSDPGDLLAVIAAVAERQNERVGLLGLGTGGVATLQGPHQSPHVAAVAVYGVGIQGVPFEGDGWMATLTSPTGLIGRLWWRARGIRLNDEEDITFSHTTPELTTVAAGMRGTASLVIAPGRFPRVPVDQARALFEAAGRPKEWLLAPQAGSNPPAYAIGDRVSDFFHKRLD